MDKPVANMVLVPREPTPEMRQAAYDCAAKFNPGRSSDHIGSVAFDAQSIYRAMVEAAPQPSLEGEVAGAAAAMGELAEHLDLTEGVYDLEASVCRKVAALLQSLSADNARLREELDGFRKATATAEAIHANMLRGGFPALSIRQALHLHGPDALARWDRADAAEARLSEAIEVLKRIADGGPGVLAARAFLDTQGGGNG